MASSVCSNVLDGGKKEMSLPAKHFAVSDVVAICVAKAPGSFSYPILRDAVDGRARFFFLPPCNFYVST